MAELAVIAPIHALSTVTALRYQWALTSKLNDEHYKRFFLRMSDTDKHVTLMQDDKIRSFLLAQYAEDIGAREIVLPYAKDQYNETVELINETLMGMAISRDSAEILRGLRPHIMMVPQGEDVFAWSRCLQYSIEHYHRAAKLHPKIFPFVPTIGIRAGFLANLEPPFLDDVQKVLVAKVVKYRVELHLLEWNTLTTFGIAWRSISTMVPFIRASGVLFNITPQFLNRKFSSKEQDTAEHLIRQLRRRV